MGLVGDFLRIRSTWDENPFKINHHLGKILVSFFFEEANSQDGKYPPNKS